MMWRVLIKNDLLVSKLPKKNWITTQVSFWALQCIVWNQEFAENLRIFSEFYSWLTN